jgi:hypothetical protein
VQGAGDADADGMAPYSRLFKSAGGAARGAASSGAASGTQKSPVSPQKSPVRPSKSPTNSENEAY